MEDSFQFIIESPQHSQGHKKRPRLVTSCDNCRLKKIKCLQPSPDTKCEACKLSKISCRFRDRERYFAERSRAIAGPAGSSPYGLEPKTEQSPTLDFAISSTSSSPLSSTSFPRSSSNSPKANGVVAPVLSSSNRYPSYPAEHIRSPDVYRHPSLIPSYNPSRGDRPSECYNSPPVNQFHSHNTRPPSQGDSRHIHLFDSDNPQRPHPNLMVHFIQLFFENMGCEFPFLVYEETLGAFWDQSLPPLLANCIAGMGSRYSTSPELVVRGLHNVAEAYMDNAMNIFAAIGRIQTFDTLHALILLSWSEYKNNEISAFRAYAQMAMNMALDLGLSDQTLQISSNERDQLHQRSTWQSIVQLHLTVSSCR